ncbi:hypothetical protein CDA63_15990 [Hymenobacter amundsenii]|uniref:PPM-type phosphatase domain-containing protein n=1 Tax=Hymenobacter amundsenii TaxID=2006685 RepID=A0A246FKF4_9BACT|nr:protein phosphatase 2C domain-containing protein [Hymenobacter amundsenii]OWP62075.1 hypothetical protein CDA63_15990 [Hymenobacter amundsenii]
MQLYQLLKRGAYHPEFCEDFSLAEPLGSRLVLAVMDGCTMGRESHFASALVAKVLRKVIKEYPYRRHHNSLPPTPTLADELRELLAAVFADLDQLKNQLLLETNELLTTLVIALLDPTTGAVEILVLGDATVALNGQLTRFEQNNRPDYLAYHLARPFADWYGQQTQRLSASDCRDLSLATDGIDSFEPATPTAPDDLPNIPALLLLDTQLAERPEMLNIKVRRLETSFSLLPTDDVAIIRVIR